MVWKEALVPSLVWSGIFGLAFAQGTIGGGEFLLASALAVVLSLGGSWAFQRRRVRLKPSLPGNPPEPVSVPVTRTPPLAQGGRFRRLVARAEP